MASSGYFNTSNQYVKYWLEVIQNWQDINNNISNVTVKVWAVRTNTGYTTWGTGSVTLKVNGTYYNSSNKDISISSSSVMLHSWTGNIGHNADGTKSLTCSASVNISGILSSSEQSYTVGLSTIPRTSSFTLNKSSCELGSSFTVNISRASSGFTHAVTFTIGGETRYMQNWNGTATSLSYTPPVTDAVYMKNSTSMGATIQVSTYSGSTLVGYTTKTLTLTCPSSIVPSFSSITVERINNYVPSSWNMYVQGKSQVKLTISGAQGIHGSTIKSYSISGGGYSGNASTLTTGVLNTSGTNKFTATITDSRGRTATKTVSINVEPYSPPRITATKYYRSNGTDTEASEGTGLWIQVNATHTNLGSKNPLSIHVASIRDLNANAVLVDQFLTSGVGKFMASGKLNTDTQYKIELIVSDGITFLPTQWLNIGTAFVTMDFKAGGKGVAIGKVAETDNLFDVDMPTMFRDKISGLHDVQLENAKYVRGKDSTNTSVKLIGFSSGDNLVIGDDGVVPKSINMYADALKLNGDHVATHGSNVNGEYYKFYDGTLICTRLYNYAKGNFSSVSGSFYFMTCDGWIFPHEFADIPVVTLTMNDGGALRFGQTRGITKSGFNSFVSSATQNNLGFGYLFIAVGRWK